MMPNKISFKQMKQLAVYDKYLDISLCVQAKPVLNKMYSLVYRHQGQYTTGKANFWDT